ncbi:DUF4365 domain-containing protein [Rhodococcus qingshengii]|uniref:DUF4365 domain-containing protein n=1 Tax=Rhodococcus erythropolis TaxID=1833 RepID=UPI0035AF586A
MTHPAPLHLPGKLTNYWTNYGGDLEVSSRKSRYSLAFISSLCAQAGLRVSETRQDEDVHAIDMSVEYPESSVRLQLKCSSSMQMTRKFETISCDQYRIDRWRDNAGPVFIVLVVVPDNHYDWIADEDRSTLHRTHAYWAQYDPNSTRKSVRVYQENRVTLDVVGMDVDDAGLK